LYSFLGWTQLLSAKNDCNIMLNNDYLSMVIIIFCYTPQLIIIVLFTLTTFFCCPCICYNVLFGRNQAQAGRRGGFGRQILDELAQDELYYNDQRRQYFAEADEDDEEYGNIPNPTLISK